MFHGIVENALGVTTFGELQLPTLDNAIEEWMAGDHFEVLVLEFMHLQKQIYQRQEPLPDTFLSPKTLSQVLFYSISHDEKSPAEQERIAMIVSYILSTPVLREKIPVEVGRLVFNEACKKGIFSAIYAFGIPDVQSKFITWRDKYRAIINSLSSYKIQTTFVLIEILRLPKDFMESFADLFVFFSINTSRPDELELNDDDLVW